MLHLPFHKKKFFRKELKKLLEESGFKVIYIKYTHPFIDFYPSKSLLSLWNLIYKYFFRYIGFILFFTPFRFLFHHFCVIAIKK